MMLLWRTVAPLLLAFLAQQVSVSSGRRGASSAGRRRASSARPTPPRGVIGMGDFTNNKQVTCLWQATEAADAVRVEIGCNPGAFNRSGVFGMHCTYTGKPQKCSMFSSKPEMFWKRVGRGLKKLQDKLCRDERAMVQAASCRRSQKDAHFRLKPNMSVIINPPPVGVHIPRPRSTTWRVPVPTVARPTNCTTREEQLRTAEEYCSSSWASVCSFFLSLVQDDGC